MNLSSKLLLANVQISNLLFVFATRHNSGGLLHATIWDLNKSNMKLNCPIARTGNASQ